MSLRCLALLLCALGAAVPAIAGQGIPVVNEGGIRDKWKLAEGVPLVAPQYPAAFVRRHDTVCIGLGYLLNADGTTSDYTLLKAWNSAEGSAEPEAEYWRTFAEAAADALKQWRFAPRPEVASPQPVYTVATFVFGSNAPAAQFRGKCAIPNLAARLREVRTSRDRRTAGDILDRLDLQGVSRSDAYELTRQPPR